jgi:Family of unknown function (DUF6256)
MSSSLIRQDLVPIIVGYALVMGALAIGLRLDRRSARQPGAADARHRAVRSGAARPATAPGAVPAPAPGREAPLADRGGTPVPGRARPGLRAVIRPGPGWLRLTLHYLATALGGYLILMGIIILYYYEVAPVAGNFVESAFTGCAMLIGLTVPVFLAASWLAERTGWRF